MEISFLFVFLYFGTILLSNFQDNRFFKSIIFLVFYYYFVILRLRFSLIGFSWENLFKIMINLDECLKYFWCLELLSVLFSLMHYLLDTVNWGVETKIYTGLFICNYFLLLFWTIHWSVPFLHSGLFICNYFLLLFWTIHWSVPFLCTVA